MADYKPEDIKRLEPSDSSLEADLDELKILTEDKESYIKQAGLDPKYVFSADNANEIKNKHNALVDYTTGFPTEEQIQDISDAVVAKLGDLTELINKVSALETKLNWNKNDYTDLETLKNDIISGKISQISVNLIGQEEYIFTQIKNSAILNMTCVTTDQYNENQIRGYSIDNYFNLSQIILTSPLSEGTVTGEVNDSLTLTLERIKFYR